MTPAELVVARDSYLRRVNYEAWLHGVYEKAAIVAALDDKSKYPEKPRPEFEPEKPKTEEQKRQEAENERLKAILFFQNMEREMKAKQKGGDLNG